MKTLVVYYSRSGAVKRLAEKKAAQRESDLLEIKSRISYCGFTGYFKGGYHAVTNKDIPIYPVLEDLSAYDTVIVCGAVWAGTICTPVRSFLKKYGHKIKQIEYVIMHADKKNEYLEVFDEMDTLSGKKRSAQESILFKKREV